VKKLIASVVLASLVTPSAHAQNKTATVGTGIAIGAAVGLVTLVIRHHHKVHDSQPIAPIHRLAPQHIVLKPGKPLHNSSVLPSAHRIFGGPIYF
jgi:hypothetical protein